MKNKIIEVEDKKYELITNYKEAFDLEEFKICYTDYYYDYDYVVGDIAYSKLRLKGFYESNNKKVKKINDIKNLDAYLKEDCAVDCKYFILKKI
ncbi:MAG: YutD-like domain-containing protein [Bacilli bacterium]